ncbi:S-adenosylmethionine:tRNA ribosyltransferase-isomerase [Psittacicella hinzii]|uniref:S-adenosylmethionine:tRNA ribosyltransferase-isomerase n=1 Tax=Psittacicella hinzii TaxID=2028575 RepID=UPI000E68F196|nr:S-adenosylmethionine:tRNA ribosyltransferase-isomerase [Psittacicella hinzii]
MLYQVNDYDFDLPDELIARFPVENRQDSRLLHFTGNLANPLADHKFTDIVDLLPDNSVLVRNNTRVIPARCFARKPSGAKVEVLVERVTSENSFLAHVRANRSPKPGQMVVIGEDKHGSSPLSADNFTQLEQLVQQYYQSTEKNEARAAQDYLTQIQQLIGSHTYVLMCTGRSGSLFALQLLNASNVLNTLQQVGHIPLPPYMEREDQDSDSERYQTVYAKVPGAVAAPTAGLHFTEQVLSKLAAKGIKILEVTLHVGAGTFMPIKVDSIQQHQMHAEWIEISPEVTQKLNQALRQGRKIIAVGTTSTRSLETMAQYSIQQYIQNLATSTDPALQAQGKDLLAKLQSLRYRDLLDKLLPTELFAFINEVNHLTKEKTLILSQEDYAALAPLTEFVVNGQPFAVLSYTDNTHTNFFTQSWQLLLNIAHNSANCGLFSATSNNLLTQLRDLALTDAEKPYSFTNHYVNTTLDFGKTIPLVPYTGNTEIFIYPGHKVHLVDYLITNFHLPKSTLIMLVSGFIGFDYTLKGYHHAIAQKYRFYSYGDSSLMPNLRLTKDVEFLM